MAYRRRRFVRKKRGSRFWGHARSALGMASTALAVAKGVKSLVNVEKKVYDVNQDTTSSSTMTVIPVSLMAEGSDYNERNGRKVKANSIYLNAQVKMNSSATATTFRCILFWDKDSDGENVTSAELMQVADDLQSPLNFSYAGSRFKILYDKFVDLSINGQRVKTIRVYRKLNHHITYLGTGATNGNLGSGNLFMAIISNETTNVPDFQYYTRFRFIDN